MSTRQSFPLVTRFLFVIMLCLPVWGSQASAQKPESYAVLDETNGTLTFKHDTKKPAGAYQLNSSDEVPGWSVKEDGDGNVIINSIEKVVFDASFADARPTSCHCWFKECYDLKTIEGIEHLNTENVTDMKSMFNGCGNLTELNVSNFDTQNVTSMTDMFYACEYLTGLNLSSFNTKNVMFMDYMFYGCYKLPELNLSSFDTQNVTDMTGMFYECSKLSKLDLSNFDTKNVTQMFGMFYGCTKLTELNISNFDTRNVTNMGGMFIGCKYLTELNISSFDTRNVTNMGYMFYTCYKLNTLNLSNFDTQNVTDMSSMFYDCNSLTAIYVGDKFVTTACEASEQMFTGCKKLVGSVPYDASKTDKEMANYTTGYFTDIKATGIDATTASGNIAAKYYDMQGRRMDAPQKGLNIVKRGDRTMKVLVK